MENTSYCHEEGIPEGFIPGEYAQISLDNAMGDSNPKVFMSGHKGIFTRRLGPIFPFQEVNGLIEDILDDPSSGYPKEAEYNVIPIGYVDEKRLRSLGPLFFNPKGK
jgi:hypothetical protein